MKTMFNIALSALVCLSSLTLAQAQKQWVQDIPFAFKIQVPSDYKSSKHMEGSDRIHAFLSPDENVAVRVRAIPFKGTQVTPAQVEELWRKSVLVGAKKEGSQNDQLNGIDGTTYGYRWSFNNTPCIVAAFITVYDSKAYVVWCLAPESLFKKRHQEMSSITQTFTILEGVGQEQNDPPVNPPAAKKQDSQWQVFVLNDSVIKFEYPSRFKQQIKKVGMIQWWDPGVAESKRVKLILQAMDRAAGNSQQSVVKKFLNQVNSSDAATLIRSESLTGTKLPVHHLSFKLDQGGGSFALFEYAIIDAPGQSVITVSYVTDLQNSAEAAPLYQRLISTLKPGKPSPSAP